MKKIIIASLVWLWMLSSSFAQVIDSSLVTSLSYDQLILARKNIALKWENLTLLQKLKARKYLVLIKEKLDQYALMNQNALSWIYSSLPSTSVSWSLISWEKLGLSWVNIQTIVSWTNLTTTQLLDWQSKLQSKPTSWSWWIFSSSYVWDPNAKWVQIAPETDFSKVDWRQFSQYNNYFN